MDEEVIKEDLQKSPFVEGTFPHKYFAALSTISEQELIDETRNAVTISMASRGKDNFRSVACMMECKRRGNEDLYTKQLQV